MLQYRLIMLSYGLILALITLFGYVSKGSWSYVVKGKPYLSAKESKRLYQLMQNKPALKQSLTSYLNQNPQHNISNQRLESLLGLD